MVVLSGYSAIIVLSVFGILAVDYGIVWRVLYPGELEVLSDYNKILSGYPKQTFMMTSSNFHLLGKFLCLSIPFTISVRVITGERFQYLVRYIIEFKISVVESLAPDIRPRLRERLRHLGFCAFRLVGLIFCLFGKYPANSRAVDLGDLGGAVDVAFFVEVEVFTCL